jgi:hypothetical protein
MVILNISIDPSSTQKKHHKKVYNFAARAVFEGSFS